MCPLCVSPRECHCMLIIYQTYMCCNIATSIGASVQRIKMCIPVIAMSWHSVGQPLWNSVHTHACMWCVTVPVRYLCQCIHMQTMVYPYMQRMREGVHRDLERQLRKRKNAEELQQQLQLQETLRDRDMSRQERWTQWHTASSVIDCGRSWRFAWSSFTCTSLYYEQCRAIPAVHSSNLTPYLRVEAST